MRIKCNNICSVQAFAVTQVRSGWGNVNSLFSALFARCEDRTFREEILLPFGSRENWGGQSSWVLTPWKCVISSRIPHGLVSLALFRLQSILLLCITELFVKCIETKAAGSCWGWSESLASILRDRPLPPLVCKGAAARSTVFYHPPELGCFWETLFHVLLSFQHRHFETSVGTIPPFHRYVAEAHPEMTPDLVF